MGTYAKLKAATTIADRLENEKAGHRSKRGPNEFMGESSRKPRKSKGYMPPQPNTRGAYSSYRGRGTRAPPPIGRSLGTRVKL